MGRKKPETNCTTCFVTYDAWRSFLDCHRRRSGGQVAGWPECLNTLFREGLKRLHSPQGNGALLSTNTDVYAPGGTKKTLKITPTPAEIATIEQDADTTGYTPEQIIALLIRIGYQSIC